MEKKCSILVVDDEEMIRDTIDAYFTANGYQVQTASNGKDALDLFHSKSIDFVILDLMLSGMSGEEICSSLRSISNVPILMLTAKAQEDDVVTGLRLGADDYVTKPFSLKQLLARVEAIYRRFSKTKEKKLFQYKELCINCETREVLLCNAPISLTPIEWRILSSMIQNQKKTFTREELLRIAFDEYYEGFERSVDTHIKNLRKKLGDDPKHPKYIYTIHGIGYRLGGNYE